MSSSTQSGDRSVAGPYVGKVFSPPPYAGHIVPAVPTRDAVPDFADAALLWYFQKAMGLQTVGAVARREYANAGPPKARTVSLAQLWLLCVGVG